MEQEYYRASQRYGWNADNEVMKKRWKLFQEHRKKCKQRNARLHNLYMNDRTAWETELQKLSPAEQSRQRKLELRKAQLLKKLR